MSSVRNEKTSDENNSITKILTLKYSPVLTNYDFVHSITHFKLGSLFLQSNRLQTFQHFNYKNKMNRSYLKKFLIYNIWR